MVEIVTMIEAINIGDNDQSQNTNDNMHRYDNFEDYSDHAANNQFKPGNTRRQANERYIPKCYNCGETGHIKPNCHHQQNYSSNNRGGNQNQQRNANNQQGNNQFAQQTQQQSQSQQSFPRPLYNNGTWPPQPQQQLKNNATFGTGLNLTPIVHQYADQSMAQTSNQMQTNSASQQEENQVTRIFMLHRMHNLTINKIL